MRKEEGHLKPGDEAQAIIQGWKKSGKSKSDLSNPKNYKKAISDYEKAMGHKIGDKTDAVLNKMVNESIIEIKEDVKIGDIILEKGDKIRVIESYESDIANKILTSLEKSSNLSFVDLVRKNSDDLGETEVMDTIKSDTKLKARMNKLMKQTGMDNPIALNKTLQKYWNK